MKKTIWVLAAALTMPAVAVLGQQSGMANGNESNHAGQSSTNRSTHDENHAMQTGSPNDNGGGLRGEYGNNQPGTKAKKKHHHHRSKKHSAQTDRRGQAGGDTGVGTSPQ